MTENPLFDPTLPAAIAADALATTIDAALTRARPTLLELTRGIHDFRRLAARITAAGHPISARSLAAKLRPLSSSADYREYYTSTMPIGSFMNIVFEESVCDPLPLAYRLVSRGLIDAPENATGENLINAIGFAISLGPDDETQAKLALSFYPFVLYAAAAPDCYIKHITQRQIVQTGSGGPGVAFGLGDLEITSAVEQDDSLRDYIEALTEVFIGAYKLGFNTVSIERYILERLMPKPEEKSIFSERPLRERLSRVSEVLGSVSQNFAMLVGAIVIACAVGGAAYSAIVPPTIEAAVKTAAPIKLSGGSEYRITANFASSAKFQKPGPDGKIVESPDGGALVVEGDFGKRVLSGGQSILIQN